MVSSKPGDQGHPILRLLVGGSGGFHSRPKGEGRHNSPWEGRETRRRPRVDGARVNSELPPLRTTDRTLCSTGCPVLSPELFPSLPSFLAIWKGNSSMTGIKIRMGEESLLPIVWLGCISVSGTGTTWPREGQDPGPGACGSAEEDLTLAWILRCPSGDRPLQGQSRSQSASKKGGRTWNAERAMGSSEPHVWPGGGRPDQPWGGWGRRWLGGKAAEGFLPERRGLSSGRVGTGLPLSRWAQGASQPESHSGV